MIEGGGRLAVAEGCDLVGVGWQWGKGAIKGGQVGNGRRVRLRGGGEVGSGGRVRLRVMVGIGERV